MLSVGALHIPNPKLHGALACIAQCVTASHSDITNTEVNIRRHSFHLLGGGGVVSRNAPMSNNYLISLLVM